MAQAGLRPLRPIGEMMGIGDVEASQLRVVAAHGRQPVTLLIAASEATQVFLPS
jgi:hypothetical protein